jgi:pimeloyl-ACP methyl ester carboxylesterase
VFPSFPTDTALPPAFDLPRELLSTEDAGTVNLYVSDAADANGDAPPVLLLHGVHTAASAYEMKPLVDRLAGRRRMFVPDLPGFGLSERSNRRYLPDLYTEAVLELLARIDQPADIVALSVSCEFAARAALVQPERVRSLSFISPTGLNGADSPMQRLNREGISPRVHHAMSNPLWRDLLFGVLRHPLAIRRMLGQQCAGPVNAELLAYARATACLPGARYAPFYLLSGALYSPDILRQVYAKLQLPVLVLYDRAHGTSFDALPELCRRRPNWQAGHIAPSRELVQWDHPDLAVQALEAFWSELVTSHAER